MHISSILAFEKVKQHHSHLLLRNMYYFFLCYQHKNAMCLEGLLVSQVAVSHVAFWNFFDGAGKRKRLLQLVHCLQTQEKQQC